MASNVSASTSNFSNLLKSSKVLHLSSSQPVVVSSHSGYLHRNDFGLKRPLPASLKKTPYVRIHAVDDAQGTTSFTSAGKESLFVKRWDEALLGVTTNASGSTSQTDQFYLRESDFDASNQHTLPRAGSSSSQSQKSSAAAFNQDPASLVASSKSQAALPMADYLNMSNEEFEAYLEEIRQLRPSYKEYLAGQASQALEKAIKHSTPAEQLILEQRRKKTKKAAEEADLYQHSLRSTNSGQTIVQFLRDPNQGGKAISAFQSRSAAQHHTTQLDRLKKEIKSDLHPAKALSYHPADSFDQNYLSDPLPARALDTSKQSDANKFQRTTSSVIGITARTQKVGSAGFTQFHPLKPSDSNPGILERDAQSGIGQARVFLARLSDADQEDGKEFADLKHFEVYPFEKPIAAASAGLRNGETVATVPDLEIKFESNLGSLRPEVEKKDRKVEERIGGPKWIYYGKDPSSTAQRGRQHQSSTLDAFKNWADFSQGRNAFGTTRYSKNRKAALFKQRMDQKQWNRNEEMERREDPIFTI